MKIIIPIQRQDPIIYNYRQIKQIYKLWLDDPHFSSSEAMRQIGEVLKDDYQS